ncbi:Single-stranded DNA-binding protein 3 [Fasciola hepatica]|uniref:Single-stranded DNA-binding protein 3 n=1 Tax=Fasciola hepatica TaxID=6192 RepID=A0A4E0RMI2_FASHE|nr:Single-stranded DNA-binding protein 3 [Fasciola hepatica]
MACCEQSNSFPAFLLVLCIGRGRTLLRSIWLFISDAIMYTKGKGSSVPSDAQSKEKLAVYVYEYLVHIGAQKTAHSFLQEIRWDKSISVGEPPGFLHSWWNVFWDLYSAAPERRDTHEHSNEAKAFHDYGFVNSGYPNGLPHPGHSVMSGPGGVGGPPGAGPGMPPPLGPPGPDPASMRPRPSGPPLIPGGGIPSGAGPGLQGPSPHHPSMRFHQAGAGGYPGIPVGGGMIPPHANLLPGAGPPHPMHGGPMLPQHHHHPPGAMIGHPRQRWMGPSLPQQGQSQPGGPPGPPPQGGGGGGPPIVCSGSAGPNSVSSAGPGSVGPVSGGGAGGGSGGGGIVQSPGHPGTPNQHVPPQHLAAPSPINNQNNCQPGEHPGPGGNLPPGHPHHPTPPHYVVGQPPQQQTPPASSNACLPPEYNTRPSPHLVFGGGPGSNPDNNIFGTGPGGADSGMMNGGGSGNSGGGGGGGAGGGGGPGGLPPRSSGMMPPPPPDYGGMPSVSGGYPQGPDLKASPLHGGPGMGSDMMTSSGGPPPLMPSEYSSGNGPGGNGGGPGGVGFGGGPDSVMMMPPPPHQQAGVLQQQPQHLAHNTRILLAAHLRCNSQYVEVVAVEAAAVVVGQTRAPQVAPVPCNFPKNIRSVSCRNPLCSCSPIGGSRQ